jgi:hypothetical protein
MVRRWRLIGYFPILYHPPVSRTARLNVHRDTGRVCFAAAAAPARADGGGHSAALARATHRGQPRAVRRHELHAHRTGGVPDDGLRHRHVLGHRAGHRGLRRAPGESDTSTHSDTQRASMGFRAGGRSRGRFATSADFPRHDCSPVPRATRTPGTFGRCPSFKRHFLSPPVPNPSVTIRNFFIAVGYGAGHGVAGVPGCTWELGSGVP